MPAGRVCPVVSQEDDVDLERKLADFHVYHNAARSRVSLEGHTPLTFAGGHKVACAELNNVRWVSHISRR